MRNIRALTWLCVLLGALSLRAQTPTGPSPLPSLPTQAMPLQPLPIQPPPPLPQGERHSPALWENHDVGPEAFWVQGDYLLWKTPGVFLPRLVTAAPAGTSAAAPGALGNADTVTVIGNDRVNDEWQSGFRLRTGLWIECAELAVEASFFYLVPQHSSQLTGSDGSSLALFRPFVNAVTGIEAARPVAFLGGAVPITGQVSVDDKSTFLGGDVNIRCSLQDSGERSHGYRLDLLTGYRIQAVGDTLRVTESLTTSAVGTTPSAGFLVQDRFRAANVFNGMQIGLDGEWWHDCFFVGARGTLALGLTHQTMDVQGLTVAQALPGGDPVPGVGGLLALPSNIGRYSRDPFTVVPALGVRVGYKLKEWLRTSLGYEFIYTSNVVRSGDQIDRVVNPNLVPPPLGAVIGPARPGFQFHGSDFTVHGLTASLELRF